MKEDLGTRMAKEVLSYKKGELRVRKMEKQTGLNLEEEQRKARNYLKTGVWA